MRNWRTLKWASRCCHPHCQAWASACLEWGLSLLLASRQRRFLVGISSSCHAPWHTLPTYQRIVVLRRNFVQTTILTSDRFITRHVRIVCNSFACRSGGGRITKAGGMEELPLAFAARDVFAGDGPCTTTETNVEFLMKNIVALINRIYQAVDRSITQ